MTDPTHPRADEGLPLRASLVREVPRLWAALALSAAFGFATRALLARTLTTVEFGAFATALAVVGLLIPIAGFGVNIMWLQVFGAEGGVARRWVAPSAGLMVITTACALGLGALWVTLAGSSPLRQAFVWLMPLVVVAVATDLLAALLQVQERFGAVAVARTVRTASRLLPAAAAFGFSWDLDDTAKAFSFVAGITAIVTVVALILLLRQRAGEPADRPTLGAALGRSWPFALAGLLFLVYFQIDILLIEVMEGERQAGLYAAATTIISVAYLMPAAIYNQYLLPKFHRWAGHDPARMGAIHRRGARQMLVAGLAVGAVLAVAGPVLLPVLFGSDYADARLVLVVLTAAVPLRFWSASSRTVMDTGRRIRIKVAVNATTALLNVVLNLALIPIWGIEGAAVATVISEGTLLILLSRATVRDLSAIDAYPTDVGP